MSRRGWWGLGLPWLVVAACGARSALDGPGDASSAGDAGIPGDAPAADACGAPFEAGVVARTAATPHIPGGTIIDPDDDILIVVGGLSASGVWAQSITAVNLGTGTEAPLATTGDSSVALGPSETAVWDAANHRAIVLGGALQDSIVNTDPSQVFAIDVVGTTAKLTLLPDFPGGDTSDLALAVIYDPVRARLVAVPESADSHGSVTTYALDLTPGHERWSVLQQDAQPALAGVEFWSAGYDPVRRRMVVFGTSSFSTMQPTSPPALWVQSLDAPSGWTKLPGDLPAPLAANIFPLFWDDDACGFVTAITGPHCYYEVWRLDAAESLTVTSMGIAPQPEPQFARGLGGFDARRKNLVFGSGFNCYTSGIDPAASSDFLSIAP